MAEKRIDGLRPVLRQVERELDHRISEACTAGAASEETTGELERLSDTLTMAAQSARAAASLRRRIREAKLIERLQAQGVQMPPDAGHLPRRRHDGAGEQRNGRPH